MERRLAAILSADVVGYSALMERDDARALERLKAVRTDVFEPRIAAHRGRLFKLVGDGALVEFPSVVGGTACAVQVQQALAERNAEVGESRAIRLRIGVHLGDVIVQGKDLYGDGVNVATRLEGFAAPGGVAISDDAYRHLSGELRGDWRDLGEQQLKNIVRSVRIRHWAPDGTAPPEPGGAARRAEGGGALPWVAVLPFANVGGDPEQEYFCEGVTEDLVDALTATGRLNVIGRNSAFAYKGTQTDPQQVARDLGVRFVADGTIRRAGNRIRVAAHLVDAMQGEQLWADRFERELDDLFAVQDEIAWQIANKLDRGLHRAEMERALRRRSEDMAAYDHMLRGWALVERFEKEAMSEARREATRALELDPNFGFAYAVLAWTYIHDVRNNWSDDPQADLETAWEAGRKATLLDERQYFGHTAVAYAELYLGHVDRAVSAIEHAMRLAGQNADVMAVTAGVFGLAGRPEEGLDHIERARALNPRCPIWYLNTEGRACYELGRYEQAAVALEQVASMAPSQTTQRLLLAATYVRLGRLEEARAEIADIRREHPRLSVGDVPRMSPYRERERLERLKADLRAAGLPE